MHNVAGGGVVPLAMSTPTSTRMSSRMSSNIVFYNTVKMLNLNKYHTGFCRFLTFLSDFNRFFSNYTQLMFRKILSQLER